MKSVTFVIPGLHAGGAERVLVEIANHLDLKVFRPQVICFAPGPAGGLDDRIPVSYLLNAVEAAETEGGVARKLWRRLRCVRRLLLRLNDTPDDATVIGFLEPTAEYLWLIRVITGRKYLTSLHIAESCFIRSRYRSRLRRAVEHWLLRRACLSATRVLVPSMGCKDDLVQHFQLPPRLIDVISNPEDLELIKRRCREAPEKELPCLSGRPLFVHVARLEESKNHRLLLSACRRLRERGEQFIVLCLGSGAMEETIQSWIDESGLTSDVILLGYVSNPYPFMSRARALVLTSHFEGFSLALVEAMACGAATIAVDCPSGPAEVLENGKRGLLVPADDAEALADAMARIIHDEDLYRELRERGYERAQDFAVSKIVPKWSDILALSSARL